MNVKAWLKVIGLGVAKWPLKVAAPVVVPFLNDDKRVNHPVFGVRDATDLSWKNIAITNGVHNLTVRETPSWWTTATNTPDDPSLENVPGFQYRRRESEDGKYVSFRMTWGKPHHKKGKNEFYAGWTMNKLPTMRLTFFQLRPLWILLIPLLIIGFTLYAPESEAADFPADITLSWTNPDAYTDGSLIEAGDLDSIEVRCYRHNDLTTPVFTTVRPDTGEGADQTETYAASIPQPGTYYCFAKAIVIDGTTSDDSNEASQKYIGKPLPPQNFR